MAADKKPIACRDVISTLDEAEQELASILAPEISEKLTKWMSNSKSISILVSGKTGTGKSTLVNGIVGKSVSKEGSRLTPETSLVKKCSLKIEEVSVNIFDSPGLEDKTHQDDKYISQINKVCDQVDLFLYCIRMSETRFFKTCGDAVAMKRLTKALGQQLWENGLIVLTFASDIIRTARDKDKEPGSFFQDCYTKLTRELRVFLQEVVEITPEIANTIPIICAGLVKKPTLPSIEAEDIAQSRAPDTPWLSNLWLKALRRTKLNAQPAMIKANLHRMKSYSPEQKIDTTTEIIEMQPIMLSQQGAKLGRVYRLGKETGERIGKIVGKKAGQQLSAMMKIHIIFTLIIDLLVRMLDCIEDSPYY